MPVMKRYELAPLDMRSSAPDVEVNCLSDVLQWRASTQGDFRALTFLANGENEAVCLNYMEMDRLARGVAARLQEHNARGQAIILLFQPGPEFLIGFLACIYAGARGVPLYPPDLKRLSRTLPRFLAIVEDCRAEIILTTSKMLAMGTAVLEFAPKLSAQKWLAVDDLPADLHKNWKKPDVDPEEVAFLQYTSGSTGDPKGVEVTHRALMLDFIALSEGFGDHVGETVVTWLPNYHDMGLIDGWLRPIHNGTHCVAMPPVVFLKNPYFWMRAISKYKAVVSGAPNFAYELCIAKVTKEERDGLDLSRWHTAYSGAEPVRVETLKRFSEFFGPCGFNSNSFSPGYGLAEATLVVSTTTHKEKPVIIYISKSELEKNRVVKVNADNPDGQAAIGVGKSCIETLLIVNPETRLELPIWNVGEIWTGGPTMASGYWNRPEVTRDVFQATLADSGRGPYLRTGDLGFLDDEGNVYICGRRKDLIIIRGRNIYPQDVEKTVEGCDPASLRPGCNAAFAIDYEDEERLVVVQEVQRRFNDEASEWKDRRLPQPEIEAFAPKLTQAPQFDEMLKAMRAAVSESYGVDPFAIVLIKAGSIPKTSSGKIQRRATRDAFLKGALEPVAQWRKDGVHASQAEKVTDTSSSDKTTTAADASKNNKDSIAAAKLRQWLRETLTTRLNTKISAADDLKPFAQLGLDSREGLILIGDMEKLLGVKLSASIIYDYPSIDSMVRHIQGEVKPPSFAAENTQVSDNEPIAVIGIGCRFPGADNPWEYWNMLRNGVDAVTQVPADRWNKDELYDSDPAAPGKMWSNDGGFINGIDQFDAQAFDITAREAARMDPQQRLLLEVTAEAFENAGLKPDMYGGTQTGVFVGISSYDYGRHLFKNIKGIDAYYGTGGALSIAANRISYQFDLHGPSIAVDSACSSSLVAVHMAVAALRRGECSMAVAGGVNAILLPDINVAFTKIGVLSPEGRCRTFDANANGITRAEGAGAVVLKPLSKALADHDHIWATILGSAVNSDGRSNGLMAPNGVAQQEVLRAAYHNAGVKPSRVQYVEAHGTGTILGDPIEVGALSEVVGKGRSKGDYCRIGSVKTNFGHLEASAGIAGIIKVILSLKNRELVPTVHYEKPNPHIPFEKLGIAVQTKSEPWPAAKGEALAGVSAFGFGGTNSHVVVAEAPESSVLKADVKKGTPQNEVLLPLSARSIDSLRELAGRYVRYLSEEGAKIPLEIIAQTAALRREHVSWRLGVVGSTRDEIITGLSRFADEQSADNLAYAETSPENERRIVFVFPGQGGQWWAMGRELFEKEPVFRSKLEEYDAIFKTISDWSLVEELHKSESDSRVNETEFTQPVLFAVQAALCELWRFYGIQPDAVVGHSMGEITAAYVAGKLELGEALRIIHKRGQIMKTARGKGAMAAVELSYDEAAKTAAKYSGRLSIAANNAPESCVLAGDPEAIKEVLSDLSSRNIFCRELRVEVAGHSPDMEPLKKSLMEAVGNIPERDAKVTIVSTVTGKLADKAAFDADYWADNLREAVRFRSAIETLLENGYTYYLEVSPHPVLQNPINQTAASLGKDVNVFSTLRRDHKERLTLLISLAAMYSHSIPVDFNSMYPEILTPAALPATPWDHKRCWIDQPEDTTRASSSKELEHPLLNRRFNPAADADTHYFESEFNLDNQPWVSDHRVQGHAVFPATGYVELVRAAAVEIIGNWQIQMSGIRYHRAMILSEGRNRSIQIILKKDSNNGYAFSVYGRTAGNDEEAWTLHASGNVAASLTTVDEKIVNVEDIRKRCAQPISVDEHYSSYLERSIDYRGAFHSVTEISCGKSESICLIKLAESEGHDFNVHPGLLDACLQVMGAALPQNPSVSSQTYMPVEIEYLQIIKTPGDSVVSHAVLRNAQTEISDTFSADIHLYNTAGNEWGRVLGLKVKRVDGSEIVQEEIRKWIYEVQWKQLSADAVKPASLQGGKKTDSEGVWLVFADSGKKSEALLKGAKDRKKECIAIRRGAEFKRINKNIIEVTPDDSEAIVKVLNACGKTTSAVERVIFMWGMDSGNIPSDASALLKTGTELCSAVINIIRALAKMPVKSGPVLWIVTNNAEALPQDASMPAPIQTALWGMGRSIAHEHGSFWGGLIDVDADVQTSALLDEIVNPPGEDQLAMRAGARLVPRLIPMKLDMSAKEFSLSADASYLISGGLGALGIELARWLVRRGARQLILSGRSGFAAEKLWPQMAAEGDKRAAELLEMRQAGVDIVIIKADASDYEAMHQALGNVRLKPLRGVIHAAGVVLPKVALEVTRQDVEYELRPKLAGAWVLHELTKSIPLDFFVVFSSASGIWGSKLLTVYGAANHFMDGLVQRRRHMGLKGLSVNWAMWGGGGMATDDEHSRFLQRIGQRPMPPEKALVALESLLASGVCQATVADIDWSVLKPLFEQEPRRRLLENLDVEKTAKNAGSDETSGKRRGGALLDEMKKAPDGLKRLELLKYFISKQVVEVLGLDAAKMDSAKSLLALGLDSLSANDLRSRIQSALPVKINVLSLLKGDSSDALAGQVLEQLADEFTPKTGIDDKKSPNVNKIKGIEPDDERLPENINPQKALPLHSGAPESMLITGTTGFLGVFVLNELFKHSQAQLNCLVKADNDQIAMNRLRAKLEEAGLWKPDMDKRIKAVAGDMSKPNLGLTAQKWDKLANELDAIYHVGFVVNFLFSYEDLRPANVLSFIDILRLASSVRVKSLHFVSSFSVLLTDEYAGRRVGERDRLYAGAGGYRQGKRACELLGEEARRRGLPLNIYRPPFIGWNSESGYYNERDFLIKLIRGCLQLGTAPDLDVLFYIAPVDFISSALVRLSQIPQAVNGNYNLLTGSYGVAWMDLVEMIRQAGGELEVEPFERWRQRLNDAGPGNPLHIFFPLMGREVKESGSAVMELFHRSSAPESIDISAMLGHLGAPESKYELNYKLVMPFVERLKKEKA